MNNVSHIVVLGDSRNMDRVNDGSIKVCVTSPPYFRNKEYETQYSNYAEYRNYLKDVWKEVGRVLSDSGLFFMNMGNSFENQFKAHEVAKDVVEMGLNLVQAVIWVKGHHSPVQGSRHLNHLYEYVFIFSKTQDYSLNRLAIGVPYKDKSNIGRWKVAKEDLRCRGDVWQINYETVQSHDQKMHDAIFPKELPVTCIKLASSSERDIVLDPFLGSGTTILAANQLGRISMGYEINRKYERVIREKLSGVRNLKFVKDLA